MFLFKRGEEVEGSEGKGRGGERERKRERGRLEEERASNALHLQKEEK